MAKVVGTCFIKERLAEIPMLQSEFAEALGLHEQYVGKYVQNRVAPSIFRALQMARVLQCDVNGLYQLED